MVVGEGDQDRLAPFRLHVVDQAGRAGILSRLLDAKGGPAAVAPEPGVHKDKIAIVRRCELYDASATPTHHRLPFNHRLLLPLPRARPGSGPILPSICPPVKASRGSRHCPRSWS